MGSDDAQYIEFGKYMEARREVTDRERHNVVLKCCQVEQILPGREGEGREGGDGGRREK
jgi:hypothetical protein